MGDLDLIRLFRLSHVVIALLGLVVFWVPVFATKGGRLHVRAGRLFSCCAYYAGGTGLLLSCWALVHLPSFYGDAQMSSVAPEALPLVTENARFLYAITGFLALNVLTGTLFGVLVARAGDDHARLLSPLLIGAVLAESLWSLGMIGFAGWRAIGGHFLTVTPPSGAGPYGVLLLIGGIGLGGAWSELQYIVRPPVTAMAWRYRHMESMLGAGVGFHAAAFFFIVKELLAIRLPGAWQLAPMLLPVAVGIPWILLWIAREERRLEPAASSPGEG